MSSTICKHNATERIKLNRPFSGFVIAAFSETDAPLTLPDTIGATHIFNPWKCQVSLRNMNTNRDVFNMPLGRLLMYLNRYEQGATLYHGTLSGETVPEGTANSHALVNMSIPLPATYDGNYQLTIEMKDSIPTGSRTSSYISVTPEWSDEPMTQELIIDDISLDKIHIDEDLGSGIEEVILMQDLPLVDDPDLLLPLYGNFAAKVKRASYNSTSGRMEEYNAIDLRTLTKSFMEEPFTPNATKPPMLVLHDDEMNSNMRVSVEITEAIDDAYIIYSKYLPNPNAEVSIMKSDAKKDKVLDDLEKEA